MSFSNRSVVFVLLAGACYGQSTGIIQSNDSIHMFDIDIPDNSLAVRHGANSVTGFIPSRLPPMIDASNQPIEPEKFAGSVPAGMTGTVSAQTLAKPPSKNALKYLNKADRYSKAGDSAKAIEILRAAPMDPAGAPYLHSRLGTEYLKAGQFALAVPELEEAARLLPREPVHHSNLAYVYKALGQMQQAEKEARLALTLDDSNAKAHFLLGAILIEHKSGLDEAVTNLKLARAELPSARFLLAQVYLYTGHRDAAVREMQDYLSVATQAQRLAAEQWLTQHSRRP